MSNENKITEQKLELMQAEDKYLRLLAEFENYKKRVNREKEEIKNQTKISTISSILDVNNDISIALKNIKNKVTKDGVELISRKITSYLNSQGIEEIQTDTYDEKVHDVVSITNNGRNIIEVISKGYTIDGVPFLYPKVILG